VGGGAEALTGEALLASGSQRFRAPASALRVQAASAEASLMGNSIPFMLHSLAFKPASQDCKR